MQTQLEKNIKEFQNFYPLLYEILSNHLKKDNELELQLTLSNIYVFLCENPEKIKDLFLELNLNYVTLVTHTQIKA